MTPLEMLLGGGRRKGRPEHRRPADAVALGHGAAHRVGIEPDRHAGAARGGRGRSGRHLRAASPQIQDRDAHFHADEVVFTSLGEGATSEGEFWEALNATCTRQLPVLFLVEDNGYAISVPVEVQTPGGDISRLVRSFPGLHVQSIDGTDFFASLRAMREAAAYVRARKGPALVHARVIRPVLAFAVGRREAVQDAGGTRGRGAARSDRAVRRIPPSTARDARNWRPSRRDRSRDERSGAAGARAPKPANDTASRWVFSPDVDPPSAFESTAKPEGKPDTMVGRHQPDVEGRDGAQPADRGLRRGRRRRQPREALAIVPGKGGVFKVTHGLQRLYGDERVFNTPIAEANIIGRALGMALRGLKPVVEIQFFDYIWPAMMQMRNEMAMMRYRTGNHSAPW